MDILKLLSRSTKQKIKASSGKDGGTSALPSAGTTTNPQLYHDTIPASRGKKRKHGEVQVADETPAQVEEEIDFFVSKLTNSIPKKKGLKNDAARVTTKISRDISKQTLLDEDDCRQILRSHRLKLTLLSANKKEKKPKKSKKASKKLEAKKDGSKPLYPQPLQTFGELESTYGIAGRMGDNLAQQGYKIPTEVQMGSLPLLLRPETALGASADFGQVADVNLLAVAPTGSGKTLAFLIPIVNAIVQRRRISEDKKIHELEAIVVAPTKELASQIVNEAKKLSIGTGVKVFGMRKGMRITARVDEEEGEDDGSSANEGGEEKEQQVVKQKGAEAPLARGDILVTTPGLLLNAISTPSPDEHTPLPNVKTLVLDEADVLLDPLFRDQTLGIWNSCTNPELRVTLWSATMGSNIESLALETLHSRKARLEIDTESTIIRLIVGLKDSAIPNITHRLTYAATEPGKLIALRQLLHPTAKTADSTESLRPPFLVFTQTIPRAIALHSELRYDIPAEAGGSSRIEVLHSDLSDSERSHVMSRFRNGETWVLITTDILSRGVDFRGINGVVNYDVPNSGASYIHRVGRTGRAGRDGGVAVTFYTKEDIPYVKNIANIIAASEKQAGKEPGEASVQKWLLDALPKPSKEQKKKLKMHGVEARRGGLEKVGEGKGKAQISTKSGYERKLENNRKGAILGSKRRKFAAEGEEKPELRAEDSEWDGIDE
ncbi:ATP-dependent RNA helicase ROK1 [Hyphodiscus hymeniophilus]|uniref:ATP-dependent RNA helicase n=1 Tax=Hyphodiscus hymeniophilus TaxID=353542 RepID=A0A9P7B0H0_9HELO|nr:ATP-dependent RNA helicase ROK1 [Hyphodiscus hymeniophilus]